MAKLLSDSIVQSDISEYLAGHSDFSFELSVLQLLRRNSIPCEHGGHYTDPVTKKSREFDIRARVSFENVTVRLAIECKNIRENFPIVVSRLPRLKEDSFNYVCVLEDETESDSRWGISAAMQTLTSRVQCLKLIDNSIYAEGSLVGKSLTQVGRATDKSITAGDSEVYEKWGQALSSLTDLVQEMKFDGAESEKTFFSTCIPILVVPNNRLWAADYNYDGQLVKAPAQIDHCSFFIGKDYSTGLVDPTFIVSHLELCTIDGFSKFIQDKLVSLSGVRGLIGNEQSVCLGNRHKT